MSMDSEGHVLVADYAIVVALHCWAVSYN